MTLSKGINLGGFLSQCEHTKEHYSSFITQSDIKDIAFMGFDHVRLAIDYEVIETEKGEPIEEGYQLIEKVVTWCKAENLNIILDLHKAYGYDFNNAGTNQGNTLFSDKGLQERFIHLWEKIATYFSRYDHVAFELLNEVVEKENADMWNYLIKQTLTAIRRISKDSIIIYGGIQWNSVKTLKLLDVPLDPNVLFTFHFYEPLLFTHQKAHWVKTISQTEDIYYPESMEYYRTKSIPVGYQGEVVVYAKSKTMGIEFIEEMIAEAIDAAKKAGVDLYCGELGVIDQAPAEDTLRWFSDVNHVFKKNQIGFAVWSYKKMDFGLIDSHYDSIRERLLTMWMKD